MGTHFGLALARRWVARISWPEFGVPGGRIEEPLTGVGPILCRVSKTRLG